VDARLDAEEGARKAEEKQRKKERERGRGLSLEGSQPGNKRAGESGAAGMRTGRRAVE